MIRPSASVTLSVWAEQEASAAKASLFSTKVLIPPLQKELSVCDHYLPNLRQLMASDPPDICQHYGVEPKFCHTVPHAPRWIWAGSRPSRLKMKNRYPRILSAGGT
jgi:hypothetical protein